MNTPLEPVDPYGKRIAQGSKVRIQTLPDWLVHDLPTEDVARLRAIEGSVMRVLELDPAGYLYRESV
jgi:hypothetical protein